MHEKKPEAEPLRGGRGGKLPPSHQGETSSNFPKLNLSNSKFSASFAEMGPHVSRFAQGL